MTDNYSTEPMTRDEASTIVARIARGEQSAWKCTHFFDRLEERKYSMQDVVNILQNYSIAKEPAWSEEYENYLVSLKGKSKDGRATDVVLGLREVGPCQYITIKDQSQRRRRKRK